MYTPENLAVREALRSNPGIVDAIRRFSQVYPTDSEGLICKDDYVAVQSRICTALVPGMAAEEIQKTVEEDWEADSQGATKLDYPRVFASVFEMADLWCRTVEAEEYLSFIEALHWKMLEGEGEG